MPVAQFVVTKWGLPLSLKADNEMTRGEYDYRVHFILQVER